MRGIDTARYDAEPRQRPAVAATRVGEPRIHSNLVARHACTGCHGMTNKIIGPGFNEIATRSTKGRNDAQSYLSKRIKDGGQGVWGAIPMPPQAGLKDAMLTKLRGGSRAAPNNFSR